MTGRAPAASVVIPTRDRLTSLAATIAALAIQSADPAVFEVIVVDNCSTANITPCLQEARTQHPRLMLRWVEERQPGPGAARNRGIVAARGDIILFTDDDCLPEPEWVEVVLATFTRHASVVGLEGLTYTRLRELTPFTHFPASSGGSFPTCNAAYRAEPLRAAGGFDCVAFPGANKEDVDLVYRMLKRGQIVFEPDARVFHPARPVSFWWQVRRMRRLLRDELCMIFRWPRATRQYPVRFSNAGGSPGQLPDGGDEVVWTTPNPVRARALLARWDLLRRRPQLYAKILLLLLVRSVYGFWSIPGAVSHALRNRTPRDPAPLDPEPCVDCTPE